MPARMWQEFGLPEEDNWRNSYENYRQTFVSECSGDLKEEYQSESEVLDGTKAESEMTYPYPENLPWYFPYAWLTNGVIDDDECVLDMPSIHEPLTERTFWLGYRLASVSLAIYSFHISVDK